MRSRSHAVTLGPERLEEPNRPARAPKVFLPYRPFSLEARLPLSVDQVTVDDEDVLADALDTRRCRVRPHVTGAWRILRLCVSVPDLEPAVRQLAFERDGDQEPALSWLMTLRCEATRLRHAVSLESHGNTLSGTLTVRRDDVEGQVELECLAARGESHGEMVPGRASEPYALLARSPRWIVEVEEAQAVLGGAFDFAWVDFADPRPDGAYQGEDSGALRKHPRALSHVAFRPQGPLVLVNRHSPEVFETLTARGTVGIRARLRDVLLQQVAMTAWRSILTEALDACRGPEAGDWADLGDEHWASLALDHAARRWKKTATREDLLDALDDPLLRPGLMFELIEDLGRVGQRPLDRLVHEACGR